MKNQLKLVAAAIVGGFLVSAVAPVSAQTSQYFDDTGTEVPVTLEEHDHLMTNVVVWSNPDLYDLPEGGYLQGNTLYHWCGTQTGFCKSEVSGSDVDQTSSDSGQLDITSSTLAPVPALTGGMLAPTADVGSVEIKKANAQYSNSAGYSDSFSVGTSTNIGSSVSASSTPDYDVNSIAIFAIGSSTIDQQIGTATSKNNSSNNTISDISEMADTITETEVSKDFQRDTSTRGGWWWWNRRNNTRTHITDDEKSTIETQYKKDVLADVTEQLESSSSMSGTISGSFDKTSGSLDGIDYDMNDVTVNGIGSDASIIAGPSFFQSDIAKEDTSVVIGAGTASGGASGNVGTTATVNANSSQFISSFGQAF